MMMMMMGNPQNIGKTPSFSHIIGFLAKWHIVDFKIRPIGFFSKLLAFWFFFSRMDNNDTFCFV